MKINNVILVLTFFTLNLNAASQQSTTIRPVLLKCDMPPSSRTEQQRELVTFGFRAERLNRLKKKQAVEEAKQARKAEKKEQDDDLLLERRVKAKLFNAHFTLNEHPQKYVVAPIKSIPLLLNNRRSGFIAPTVQIQELVDIPQEW
ncbi:MAG TPA: hypothetical protein VFF04_02095 [Candidatus Babeliales bacterium]|nr:hypothetical protein [Candidatus Babeliales bacterium]